MNNVKAIILTSCIVSGFLFSGTSSACDHGDPSCTQPPVCADGGTGCVTINAMTPSAGGSNVLSAPISATDVFGPVDGSPLLDPNGNSLMPEGIANLGYTGVGLLNGQAAYTTTTTPGHWNKSNCWQGKWGCVWTPPSTTTTSEVLVPGNQFIEPLLNPLVTIGNTVNNPGWIYLGTGTEQETTTNVWHSPVTTSYACPTHNNPQKMCTKTTPGYFTQEVNYGFGAFDYASVLNLNLDNILDVTLGCAAGSQCTTGTWSLNIDSNTPDIVNGLLGRSLFDELALVIEANNQFMVYDFNFPTLAGLDIDYNIPYSFAGTWSTRGFGYDLQSCDLYSVQSISLVGRDPNTAVPLPGTLALIGIGLFGLGFTGSRRGRLAGSIG